MDSMVGYKTPRHLQSRWCGGYRDAIRDMTDERFQTRHQRQTAS
jgi:hypothetical protein